MVRDGLISAPFTPFDSEGNLKLQVIDELTDFLVKNNISGVFVAGTTGEGFLLEPEERMKLAEKFVEASDKRLSVIIHVGAESIKTSEKLAKHAQDIGADAIASVCPSYYSNIVFNDFVGYFHEIAKAAPNVPFFLYHIPVITHFKGDLLKLLKAMAESIPTFAGVKYSDSDLTKLQECLEWSSGRYKFFYGVDNMIVYSLTLGVNGLIGSTYNVAPRLYNKIIEYHQNKDLIKAMELQSLAIKMVRIFEKYGGLLAIKAVMRIVGIDFGPMRLPIKKMEEEEFVKMERELKAEGLIEWIG